MDQRFVVTAGNLGELVRALADEWGSFPRAVVCDSPCERLTFVVDDTHHVAAFELILEA